MVLYQRFNLSPQTQRFSPYSSVYCSSLVLQVDRKAGDNVSFHFTFVLPCIVIDFFLNNQPDALIIPVLFCYKTLHVSGIFFAHHQEFSTVHSAEISFMQILMTASKQSEDGLCLEAVIKICLCLEAVIKICMKLTSAECTVENS